MKIWNKISVFLLLTTAGICCCGCEQKEGMEIYEVESEIETEAVYPMESDSEEISEKLIFVDVCGAVKAPGVYEIPVDSRAFLAIEMAGGMLPEAAGEAVNQAALLMDGQQLYVPYEGEEDRETADAGNDGKINLNTADIQELTTLPGIGEARAADIIAYREEHGEFSSIEEIKNVSGIKDAAFEKMKDKIKVQ